MITPRPYQEKAITAAIEYFNGPATGGAFEILPTGSGKSVVIANIAAAMENRTIVLQPSKEILEQNFAKFTSYGFRAGIYSASAGSKLSGEKITFAMIGSIINKVHLFKDVKAIIIDECHLVNAKGGMYEKLIKALPEAKVLGLTATPYRLSSSQNFGAMLKFLNRTRPRIFEKVLYYIQNKELFDAGHLAKLEYFVFNVGNRAMLKLNSSGTSFTDASIRDYNKKFNLTNYTVHYANRLLGKGNRKNLLIFCSLIEEAEAVSKGIPGSVVITGETETDLRGGILTDFKNGKIKCVINVGVLTTGFDYPELECVLLARSTMSLSLYYQMIGRAMRPHPNKESAWIVDLGGNINFFGKIETMEIKHTDRNLFYISNKIGTAEKILTNVAFSKN